MPRPFSRASLLLALLVALVPSGIGLRTRTASADEPAAPAAPAPPELTPVPSSNRFT